ncbi:MAG TPA: SDR family NAD(P)-dependent oxidoreductase, partial [Actinomycetota bacterium]|nr:SDR family NAD(P)-dependent oxidoreductase [Actinomycetota bacterium]
MELRGAVAVVTGASSGIGESTALLLARAGASVVLAARRLERLEALADRIHAHGGDALPVHCDVAEPTDLAELVERTDAAFGRCDLLVNNAGIPGGGPFHSLPPERIERVARVNVLGV